MTLVPPQITELRAERRALQKQQKELSEILKKYQTQMNRVYLLLDKNQERLQSEQFLHKLQTSGGCDNRHNPAERYDGTWWDVGSWAWNDTSPEWAGKYNGVTKTFTVSGSGSWREKMSFVKKAARTFAETGCILVVRPNKIILNVEG